MDRCALFVDAGYLLADGAMAVHGTRHREAVAWDYPGLLQLMTNLSRERTGLPLLRCYWYEATVEGRRTPEHDALADIPGLKLRLSRIRPGRREGVDAQVHRDLMTLARNTAICDAVVVSGDEDLAQVVCDAQDLGIRVTVIHIAADGGWAVSRSLRQECDDLVELGGVHLRPYVTMVSGATESSNGHHQPLSNGHAAHSLPPAPVSAPPSSPASLPPAQSTGSHAASPSSSGSHAASGQPSANGPVSSRGQSSSPPVLPSYSGYQEQPPSIPPSVPPSATPATGPLQQPQSASPSTGQFATPSSGGTYQAAQLGPYTGPQPAPVSPPPAATAGATTLADAVKAAHREGHDFGESVARDAPALWLEAVLARKPRMPSDLEARLLQGSSLPIDFLLHDEVRHALRRGFWDALERARH
ncbi:NYN domain-containing protein [Nonomuraea sp. WAC 01424]|uniref:NYN domain-containing protein n=1 Tax=Nonomuraea sp. WAC 01424 TaxID=2203200 RepID=UPI000F7ADA69|nr:NYN domain-containing protein [Nonomuraea sp. WAC 01424]RSN01181.1 NYN domain-containing protein [Nonomuraea sp. WAC 01424]